MQDLVITDDDLRLINALQVRPRASWTLLGNALHANPVTLARRWDRLVSAGHAWVTIAPDISGATLPQPAVALVEVHCQPGTVMSTAQAFAAVPEVVTIDVTAGGRDLMLTLVAPDQTALAALLLEQLHTLGSVVSMQSHPVARAHTDASTWRLRTLSRPEIKALTPPIATARPDTRLTPLDVLVAAELARDGRVTASEVAHRLAISPRRARDSLTTLTSSTQLRFRVELLRSRSGYPVYAWYLLQCSATQRDRLAAQLGAREEIRAVLSTIGPHSLAVAVWMRTLEDVHRLETAIENQIPGARIVDRSVVLRTVKRMGHVLDETGRATNFVPLRQYLQRVG